MAGNEEKDISVIVERKRTLAPDMAIVYYSERGNQYGSEYARAAIQFQITEQGQFVKPRALDMRCMQEIFNSPDGNPSMEFLDNRILAVNNTAIVWFEPSRKAEIFFDCTEESRKDLNVLCKGKKVWWPALVFKLRHGSLFCRALKDSRRPGPRTKLYVAPLTHIAPDGGRVCPPRYLHYDPGISMIENMKRFSEDFYRGIFGHATAGDLTSHPGGHDGLWREILTAPGNRRFPNQYLRETRETLQDFLQ